MIHSAKQRFAVLLSGLVLTAGMAVPVMALEVGEPAPAIEATSTAGAPVRISAEPGKVLYIDFWASWCGPCRQSFPWMNEMQAKYRDKGLQIVGINLDAQSSDASRFLEKIPAQFTIAYDARGTSAVQYGVKGMPSSVLIGRDGKVLARHMGFNAESRAQLEQEFEKLLGGTK